jgi:multiple sugar transport system permease protein
MPKIPGAAAEATKPPSVPAYRLQSQLLPYLLVTPVLAVISALVLYPMAQGALVSLYEARDLVPRAHEFAGLANFVRLFQSDATLTTIRVTLVYVLLTTGLSMVIALAAALVLNASFKGRAFFRAALTIPWGTPLVAAALIWFWMLDPQYGVINFAVRSLGLTSQGIAWLISPQWAMPAVVLVDVWRTFPFGALVLLTALQAIDPDLYGVAAVDGANQRAVFRHVILPSIRPSLGLLGLLYTIWGMKRFDTIWILTQGGPADTTNVLSVYIYREAFRNFRIGDASAMALVGAALSVLVTLAYFAMERRRARA